MGGGGGGEGGLGQEGARNALGVRNAGNHTAYQGEDQPNAEKCVQEPKLEQDVSKSRGCAREVLSLLAR